MPDKQVKVGITATTSGLDAGLGTAARGVDKLTASFKHLPEQAGPGLRSLRDSIEAINPSLQKVGSRLGMIGAAGVAAFVGGAKVSADYALSLENLAGQLGTTQTEAEALSRVVEKSGLSVEKLGMAVGGIMTKMRMARAGNEEARKSFAEMGIDIDSAGVKALSTVGLLALVAKQLQAIPDSQTRIMKAMELGLSARSLKFLALGDIQEKMKGAATGPTFLDQKALDQLMEVDRSFKGLAGDIKGTLGKLFADAGPQITDIIIRIDGVVTAVSRWTDKHKALAGLLTTTFGAGSVVLIGIGLLVKSIFSIVDAVTKVTGAVSKLGAATSAWKAIGAAQGMGGAASVATGMAPLVVPALTIMASAVAIYATLADIHEISGQIKATSQTKANLEAWNKLHPEAALPVPSWPERLLPMSGPGHYNARMQAAAGGADPRWQPGGTFFEAQKREAAAGRTGAGDPDAVARVVAPATELLNTSATALQMSATSLQHSADSIEKAGGKVGAAADALHPKAPAAAEAAGSLRWRWNEDQLREWNRMKGSWMSSDLHPMTPQNARAAADLSYLKANRNSPQARDYISREPLLRPISAPYRRLPLAAATYPAAPEAPTLDISRRGNIRVEVKITEEHRRQGLDWSAAAEG